MTFTYNDFRDVLKKSGFLMVRSKKHETWQKELLDGSIFQVRVSHQAGRDIPTALFHRMLRQANLTQKEFTDILNS